MALSSFKKIGVAVAYASAVTAATQSYQVSEEYTTDNFFDKFDFFTSTYTDGDSWDPTHGYVQYRSQADAESLGLISTSNGQIYIGPDHNTTYDPEGKGRDSVRITSKATYHGGLMIAKFAHLPVQACGAWPAFWSYASPWLTTGEIDFYEGWNLMGYNRIAMHVNETLAGECTLSSTSVAGTVMTDDCNNDIDGSGCGVQDSTSVWGSTSGATFAWEWTDSAIKVWSWTPGSVPSDVTAGTPDPSSDGWGNPQLLVEQSNCDLTKAFSDLQLTFNIDFCGDTAGSPSIWNATCSAQGSSCAAYVADNPSAFVETYFSIDSIRFYELKDVVASSSSAVVASTTSVSSSTSTQGGLLSGTVSVLESTLDVSSVSSTVASTPTAAAAAAAEHTSYPHTTSYIYGTSTSIDENGSETTVVVVVDTTICPVTASEASVSSKLASESSVAASVQTTSTSSASVTAAVATSSRTPGAAAVTSTSSSTVTSTQLITSTIFSTSSSTITSCASTASACTTGDVTTVVVAVSTTICPVTATEGSASAKASTAVASGSAPGVSGAATSDNSAQQATKPGSSSSVFKPTTLTRSSAVTLVTSSSSTTAAGTTGTEVETATDTAGALETASGTPTGNAASHNYGINGTVTGAITSSGASATATSSCSGLDCVVVSSSGYKTGTTFGASGFALAVFAGAAFLL